MELKSLDVLVLLKMIADKGRPWSYSGLSEDLGVSVSQVHAAVRRAAAARLMEDGDKPRPYRPHLKEFLIHGMKYCFPAEQGRLTRGIPTAYAAPPLNSIILEASDLPPVWPSSKGQVRGTALLPIHRAVPEAASRDSRLYELLALLDSIRTGRARERELAARELTARIDHAW